MIKSIILFTLLLWHTISCSKVATDKSLYIAVSSNFYSTLKTLSKRFTQQTGIKVKISTGSSGILFAQIKNGAPYDIFLSADSIYPKLLEQDARSEAGTRFTYAVGKLVVWSPKSDNISPNLSKILRSVHALKYIAVANPKVAPYGREAIKVLRHYKLLPKLGYELKHKLAFGGNVGKVYQYVSREHAQLGILAYSYVINQPKNQVWKIPENLYSPIEQQLVVLKGRLSPLTKRFLRFLKSQEAKKIILSYGYNVLPI